MVSSAGRPQRFPKAPAKQEMAGQENYQRQAHDQHGKPCQGRQHLLGHIPKAENVIDIDRHDIPATAGVYLLRLTGQEGIDSFQGFATVIAR